MTKKPEVEYTPSPYMSEHLRELLGRVTGLEGLIEAGTAKYAIVGGAYHKKILLKVGQKLFLFDDCRIQNTVTGRHGGEDGYNVNALYTAEALVAMGELQEDTLADFCAWWKEAARKDAVEREVEDLKSLAKKHGYALRKEKK